MDRNSAIGLTLIALLLLMYFYFFSPQPQPVDQQPVTTEQPTQVRPEVAEQLPEVSDSLLAITYGDLSAAIKGEEKSTVVETEDLRIVFSSRGGVIKELLLKNFKTYDQQPLYLITPEINNFSLTTKYQGRDIDLYALFYSAEQQQRGDTTEVNFSITANGSKITHRYKIPQKGFEVKYAIEATGFNNQFTGDNLAFEWKNLVMLIEKDIDDLRNNTTITYYSNDYGFDELSQRSTSTEMEVLRDPLKWVAIKQKFFLSSIIADNRFAGGEIQTVANVNVPNGVKQANIKLLIPTQSLSEGDASYKFYFGPNNYRTVGKVTDQFSKNVYLGWPPVYWINKFIIFPVFHFLTKISNNYGLIIIILVILLKLVLFPLSYKSYLSMAKMRVLKPELDEIKERVGEDMTKVQQEQMKLYQQVGVNPISGCIPVLLQMPILFAMFYLFPASIELRQQPLLWAEDLSTYDSVINFSFSVPLLGNHISLFTLLMTLSTLIYTWQNNQISSVQGPMKSMSYLMPLVFFFVLNSFSAGLTFYYLVSNLVTFSQQAIIKRFVDEDKIKAVMEENKKKFAAGGAKKSKFMLKLEEAMKASEEARKKSEDDRKKKKK